MHKSWFIKKQNGGVDITFSMGKNVSKNFMLQFKKGDVVIWFYRMKFQWFFIEQDALDEAAKCPLYDKYARDAYKPFI